MFEALKKSAENVRDRMDEQAVDLRARLVEQVDRHEDQINAGLDRAGKFVDAKTGGKYADKVARGKSRLRESLDRLDVDGPHDPSGGSQAGQ
jgi:hypothetical protein